jgi:hypothetical protein
MAFGFFDAPTPGDPSSFSALENRRKIALAMMARDRKGYPKNVGEGLTAIGDALGERSQLAQLDAQQAAYDKWNADHPPPAASELMRRTEPPASAATGPRAEASPQLAPGAQPVQAAEVAAPWQQTAVAANDAYQPVDALPPIQDAGGAPQMAAADTGTLSDAPPVGAPTGQPNPAAVRASIAQLVNPRQGVPPQNPLLGGGQSPANMPSTLDVDPSLLGSPLDAAKNPPRPFKVAQAPGTAPSIPEINSVTPPVAMPPPGPVQQPPNARYNQMELKGADLEQWGNQRGDPRAIAQGQLLQKIGKEQRDRENADLQKKYEMDRSLESQRVLEQQRAEQGKGLAQKQLEEATAKAADAQRANRFGGATGYQKFTEDMSTSRAAIQPLANTLPMYDQAKAALKDAYTGTGAEVKLDANKMLRGLGVPGDYTPSVATEILRSRMSAIAAGFVKGTVGGQNISNQDVKFVEKAYSGDITMEPESLRRLLNIAQRAAIDTVNQHNDRLNGVARHPDDSTVRDMFRVPMQYGNDAEILKKRGNEQEIRDFFDKKYGKGHADAVLRGKHYGDQ